MPINIACLSSAQYPIALRNIYQPPSPLYYRGAMPEPDALMIAFVGSRKMTDYGRKATEHIISGLADQNITIISGLAYGVDAHAHRCALKYGLKTIAVLGGGIDDKTIYPKEHLNLAKEIIAAGGAIISQFPPGTIPMPRNFPVRNTIIAGMSRATVIIEADFKSGARITGKLALAENRDVFALPGNIFDQQSRGTNDLIKQGAAPITSAEDILRMYGLKKEPKTKGQILDGLAENEQKILKNIGPRGTSLAQLQKKTSLPPAELSIGLTKLEMLDIIRKLSNNKFALRVLLA